LQIAQQYRSANADLTIFLAMQIYRP
jgi:hypothetical protein